MRDSIAGLVHEADALCADTDFRAAIAVHAGWSVGSAEAARLDTTIAAGDQMLRHSLVHHRDANASYAQYFNVALQQYRAARQILAAVFPDGLGDRTVLDFACGYGRLLRFLSLDLPREQLFASEIQTDALRFVCDHFGAQGIAFGTDPADFQPGRQFDVIWVASLFSHLPESLFRAWLARLHDCLTPDGVLCFSVHDAVLVPPEHRMPDEGYLFFPVSENADLDSALYGTTYVSEAWVAATVAQALGREQFYWRIPRALAHEQDIYVLPGSAGRDLSALGEFRRGPWGWADERRVDGNGELYLRGWAASFDDGALPGIDVWVDEAHFAVPTGLPRPDVGMFFDDPRMNHSGWEFRHRLAPGQRARVVVSAPAADGERALIYAGMLAHPIL